MSNGRSSLFFQAVIAVLFAVVILVFINAVCVSMAYDLGYKAGVIHYRFGKVNSGNYKSGE